MAIIKSGVSADQWTIDASNKAGRVGIYDTAGHIIGSTLGTDGVYQLNVNTTQNAIISILNSSEVQINAGVTWSGDSESTLGVAGIQVNTFLDKTHTVTVLQSMDGNNWDISDSYTNPASFGHSRTFQATASYYKVTVKNEAAGNTGTVRIQTVLCPIVEALPRALTHGGNLKVTPCAEWQNTKLTTGLYAVSSFRTLGVASSTQSIFTIENPAASLINVAVRGLSVATDSTAALTTVAQQIKLSRATGLPTGGTVLTATKYKTSYASPTAICRSDTASDSGGETAITATAGATLWTQFIDRPHTVVGWMTHPGYNMIPDVGTDLRQLILVPGEALYIQGVVSIPTTTHVIVNCSWLEYSAL